ncbi:MAG: hypothetical protein IJ735_00900 [Clostridia bacterium]|nr:hypothetical protein [Clostridia bacterium]
MKKISAREVKNFFKSVDHRHYVCIGITVAFALISAFCFPYAFPRLGEAFRDFGRSIAYYFTELFGYHNVVVPSVTAQTKMPFTLTNVPITWEEFTVKWGLYWQQFIDVNNVTDYFVSLGKDLRIFGYVLTLLIPLVVVVVLLINHALKSQNIRYNEDTKPLRVFKQISDKTYRPVKAYLLSLFSFIMDFRLTIPDWKKPKPGFIRQPKKISYWEIWACIWILNFNVLTIVFEALAYYFYFVVEFDVLSLYTQVYKLLLDLSVMFKFIPIVGWVIIACIVFDKIRKSIGYKKLQHHEMMNRGFINERSVFKVIVAPMRGGKDKFMTSMALSKEAMYRDQCLKTMRKADLKFPYFPWIEFERHLLVVQERKIVRNLVQMRDYIRFVERCFILSLQDPVAGKACRRYLQRAYGYTAKNLCFDYDLERYSVGYDNAKYIERIFDVLCDYAQAFFIYIVRSSLIFANYPIRVDATVESIGNFPFWNDDFFKIRSSDVDYISRFCKVLNWDYLRLGRKCGKDPDFAFEFGIVNITEMGKDRPNMLESEGLKKADVQTNPKNDGFNDEVKIVGHGGNVDYYCFADINGNDQREEQIPAALLGTAEILRIEDCEKGKMAMPFFFFGECLHDFLSGLWAKLHRTQRFNKGNNTLLYYVLHTIIATYESYYDRRINTFGYELMTISVQDGNKQNEKVMHAYYISNKKDLSKRYPTDAFGDVLAVRGRRAIQSVDEADSYTNERASVKEFEQQNSYMYPRLFKYVESKDGSSEEEVDPSFVSYVEELIEQNDLSEEVIEKLILKQREKILAGQIEEVMTNERRRRAKRN